MESCDYSVIDGLSVVKLFIKIIVLEDVNVYHDGDSDDHEYDNDDNDDPVHINDFTECGQYLGCVAQYIDAPNRYRDPSHSHLSNIVISGASLDLSWGSLRWSLTCLPGRMTVTMMTLVKS